MSSEMLGTYAANCSVFTSTAYAPFSGTKLAPSTYYPSGNPPQSYSPGWMVSAWPYQTDLDGTGYPNNLKYTYLDVPPSAMASNILHVNNLAKTPINSYASGTVMLETYFNFPKAGTWNFYIGPSGSQGSGTWTKMWVTNVPNWYSSSVTANVDPSQGLSTVNIATAGIQFVRLVTSGGLGSLTFTATSHDGNVVSQLGPHTTGGLPGEWIELKMPAAASITNYNFTSNLSQWALMGSNDYVNWAFLDVRSAQTTLGNYSPSNVVPTQIVRLVALKCTSNFVSFNSLNFYGPNGRISSVVTSNKQDTLTNTVFGGSYTGALTNGEYLEIFLPASVPVRGYILTTDAVNWQLWAGTNYASLSLVDSQQNQLVRSNTYVIPITSANIFRVTSNYVSGFSSFAVSYFGIFSSNGSPYIPVLSTNVSTLLNSQYIGYNVSPLLTTVTQSANVVAGSNVSNFSTVGGYLAGVPSTGSVTTVGATNYYGEWVQESYAFANVVPGYYTISGTATSWLLLGSVGGSTWTIIGTPASRATSNINFFNTLRLVLLGTTGTTVSGTTIVTDQGSNIISNTSGYLGGSYYALNPIVTQSGLPNGDWVQLQYASPVSANALVIYGAGSASYVVVGSTTGSSWTSLVSNTLGTPPASVPTFVTVPLPQTQAYSYYRVIFTRQFSAVGITIPEISILNSSGQRLIPSGVSQNQTSLTNPVVYNNLNNLGASFPGFTTGNYYTSGGYSGPLSTVFYDLFTGTTKTIIGDYYQVSFTSPASVTKYVFQTNSPTLSSWSIVGSNDGFNTGNVISSVSNYFLSVNPGAQVNVATVNTFSYNQFRFVYQIAQATGYPCAVSINQPIFIGPSGPYFNATQTGTTYANTAQTTSTTVGTINGEWIQMALAATTVANVYTLSTSCQPISWYLLGSNNSTQWDVLHSVSNNYYLSASYVNTIRNLAAGGYQVYRLIINEAYSPNASASTIAIFNNSGSSIIPALTSDSTVYSYRPVVSTSMLGSFTITASRADYGSLVSSLFDFNSTTPWWCSSFANGTGIYQGATSTYYQPTGASIPGEWFDIVFPQQVSMTKYGFLHSLDTSRSPNNWIVLGSTDSVNFTNIISNVQGGFYGYPTPNTYNVFSISNATSFSRVRFITSNTISSSLLDLRQFRIFGASGSLVPYVTVTGDVYVSFDSSVLYGCSPTFGGLVYNTTQTNYYSGSTNAANGTLLGTIQGEYTQVLFPVPINYWASKPIFINIKSQFVLPANVWVLGANLLSMTAVGATTAAPFYQPTSANYNQYYGSGQALIASGSNIYQTGNVLLPIATLTCPLPSGYATPQTVDLIRIIVSETAPWNQLQGGSFSTATIGEVEFLDNRLRRVNAVFGPPINTRTDPSSATIVGGQNVLSTATITSGVYRGSATTTVQGLGAVPGEWFQYGFAYGSINTDDSKKEPWGYRVAFANAVNYWTLVGSTDGATWYLIDNRRTKTLSGNSYQYSFGFLSTNTYYRIICRETFSTSAFQVSEFAILNNCWDQLSGFFNQKNLMDPYPQTAYTNGWYQGLSNIGGDGYVGDWITLQTPSTVPNISSMNVLTNVGLQQFAMYGSNDGVKWNLMGRNALNAYYGTYSSNTSPCIVPTALAVDIGPNGTYTGSNPLFTVTALGGTVVTGGWAELVFPSLVTVASISFTVPSTPGPLDTVFGQIAAFYILGSTDYVNWNVLFQPDGTTRKYGTTVVQSLPTTTQYRWYRVAITQVDRQAYMGLTNLSATLTSGATTGFAGPLENTYLIDYVSNTMTLSDYQYYGLQIERVTNPVTANVAVQTLAFSSKKSPTGLIPPTAMTANNYVTTVYGINSIGYGSEYVQIQTSGSAHIANSYTFQFDQYNLSAGLPVAVTLLGSNDGLNFSYIDAQSTGITNRTVTSNILTYYPTINGKRYNTFRLVVNQALQTFTTLGTVGILKFSVTDYSPNVVTPNVVSFTMYQNQQTFNGLVVLQANVYRPDGTYSYINQLGGEYATFTFPQAVLLSSMSVTANSFTGTLYGGNKQLVTFQAKQGGTNFNYQSSYFSNVTGSVPVSTSQYFSTFTLVVNSLAPGVGQASIGEVTFYDILGERRQFLVPFCLDTNSVADTGFLNFSQLNQFGLTNTLPTTAVYAVSRNLLDIKDGRGKARFS